MVTWIVDCQDKLKAHFAYSEDSVLLLDAFLGQLDGVASNQLGVSKSGSFKTWIKGRLFGHEISVDSRMPDVSGRGKVDILFWPWMNTHVRQMRPLLQSISGHSELKAAAFSHNTLQADILKGLDRRICVGFTNEKFDLNLSMERFGYIEKRNAILARSRSLPLFKTSGKALRFDLVLEKALRQEMQFFYTLELYREFKSALDLKAIFIGNDLTLQGRTVALLAKRDGLHTFSIMHGALKNPLWKKIAVDTFFVFGSKDMAALSDVHQSEVVLSGSPLVDDKRIKRTHSLDRNSVLIAFSGPGHSISLDHHLSIIQNLTQAARQLSYEFRLRLHPKDSQSYYRELLRLTNVKLVDPNDEDIFESLSNARVLITSASMTALDAMLYEVPVLTIDLQNEVSYVDFISQGATTHVTRSEQLQNHIKQLYELNDEPLNQVVQRQNIFFKRSFEHKEEGSTMFIVNHINENLKHAG